MNQVKKPRPPKPTLKKFRTPYSANRIEEVMVIRETAAFVYVPNEYATGEKKPERREAKSGEFAQYHDTWAAAHAYLIDRAQEKVRAARRQLELANAVLGNVKGLKPPKEGT